MTWDVTEHGEYTYLFYIIVLFPLNMYQKVEMLGHIVTLLFICLFIYLFTMFKGVTLLNFLRNLYSIFHSGHQFTFPPTVSNGSIFSTSFSAFIISCLFENSYPNRCMLTYYCIWAGVGWGGGRSCMLY